MRVVIDTNVFISSFLGKGNPKKIIDLWKNGKIIICLSKEIIEEYIEVLQRLGLDGKKEIEEILQLFARGYHSIFTATTQKLEIVIEDPDDYIFFECAVSLESKYIISGDKAVLKIKEYCNIKVMNPTQFLTYFTTQASAFN